MKKYSSYRKNVLNNIVFTKFNVEHRTKILNYLYNGRYHYKLPLRTFNINGSFIISKLIISSDVILSEPIITLS